MAIVSRISTLTFSGATGSRTWQATAVQQDTAAGSSVVITTTVATEGAAPPNPANTLSLNIYNSAGTLVRTYALTPGLASQDVTFFFTADGTSGGAARCGTVSIDIRATKTTGGPTATYDYETDGAPNTPPVNFTATVVDRGWIRGTTTGTFTLSNVSFGGAKPSPFAYPDSVFERLVLGATPFNSQSITLRLGTAPVLSQSVASATATFQNQFSAAVDNRFAAASTTHSTDHVVANNSGLATGAPWTVITPTNDSADFDPRITCTHLRPTTGSTSARWSVPRTSTTKPRSTLLRLP